MKHLSSAFAGLGMLVAFAAATPVFAQGAGSGGDNSQVTQCKTKLEQVQLSASTVTDTAKKSGIAQELTMAKDAQAKGEMTQCLVHLEKATAMMK